MILLGIDLALRRTGYAFLDGDHNTARLLSRGVIDTAKLPHNEAVTHIGVCVDQLIGDYTRPDAVYIEVPGSMNRDRSRKIETVEALGKACGAVLMVCTQRGVPVVEITQSDVKACVARPLAKKEEVQLGLSRLASAGLLQGYDAALRKRGGVDADQADAVAVAWAGLRQQWLSSTRRAG